MAYRVVPTKGRCGNGACGRSVRALDCRRTTLAEGRIGSGSLATATIRCCVHLLSASFFNPEQLLSQRGSCVADVVVGVMVGLLAYGRFVA
jgi:hypothetical protein